MGFAIENPITLLDDGVADGLGDVTFPAAWRYQNIMLMGRRSSEFTIRGIRYVDRNCACEGV